MVMVLSTEATAPSCWDTAQRLSPQYVVFDGAVGPLLRLWPCVAGTLVMNQSEISYPLCPKDVVSTCHQKASIAFPDMFSLLQLALELPDLQAIPRHSKSGAVLWAKDMALVKAWRWGRKHSWEREETLPLG